MKKNILVLLIVGLVVAAWVYFSASPNIPENNKIDAVKETALDENEIRDLIGQMLIVGFRGTSVDENSYIVKTIKNLNLGGIILFDYDIPNGTKERNIINPIQTKKLISDISSYSKTPLFITIDAEGGMVNRLKPEYGFAEIPSHELLGKTTEENTRRIAETLGRELSELGINFDFAPVVDLYINPQNPIIGKLGRSFGNDPEHVTNYASAFIEGLHKFNILTSLKHFPGHGSSNTDSHLGMVDITKTYQEKELEPFKNLIEKKLADTVMVAHVFNRNIDPNYPASLSEKFIRGILREKFRFDGVVISDDMDMGAIRNNYGFEDAIVKAVQAGTDMLIISNNGSVYDESSPKRAVDAIWNSVKTGDISPSDIYASTERIKILKEKIK